MNLRGRIPVEPLDDDRLVRVERAVVAGYADAMSRGRAPSRWLVPALAGAALAAIVAVVLVYKLRPTTTPPPAAAIRVDNSHLDLGDATLSISPDASFTVTRPDNGVLITLDRGLVDLQVASRKDRAPLIVRAGDVDVIVIGTHFSVERATTVTVTVTEGVVSVKRGTSTARVAAGQRWSAPAQVALDTPFPEPTTIVATADPIATGGTIPSGPIATTDQGTGPELRDRDAVVPPDPVVRDRDRNKRNGSGAHDGSGSGSDSSSEVGSAAPSLDLIPAIRRESVVKPFDVGVTGDDALKKYMELIRGTPEDRLRGYYGAAYVLRSQGKHTAALTWLERYKGQSKDGPEIESVMWMRVQLLCKLPVDEECRTAAHAYLRKFTGSDRAALATRLTNEM